MHEFRKISDIELSKPETWQESVFMTIDIDWAHDDVLSYAIDLAEQADIPVTWFITHETKLLDRLRKNSKFELAIHPNFNFLLSGTPRPEKTAEEVVDLILGIVPEAVSVRSHSMTQNTYLMRLFWDRGLQFDCNHFIPHQAGMAIHPWVTWNGMVKVPYFWEDDLACVYNDNVDVRSLKQKEGLRVFDFHPIHLYLNTENLDRYEDSRQHHRNPEKLKTYIYDGNDGACSKFKSLVGIS